MFHKGGERLVLSQRDRALVGNYPTAWGPYSNVVVSIGAVRDVGGNLLIELECGRVSSRAMLTIAILT